MTELSEKAGAAPAALVYLSAFVVGAIVMSFEMLGSRYLNPYFGSGIYTWASLISTVLLSLTVGYFIGGWLADRMPSLRVLGVTVVIGSVYILVLPTFSQPVLEAVLSAIDDIKIGSLVSSMVILFFPVVFLGMFSPFAIRLLLRSASSSGTVSGTVYGISTAGSIVGTLGTTFYLIPSMGSRAITLMLGGAGIAAGLLLIFLPLLMRSPRKAVTSSIILLATALACFPAHADTLVDQDLRNALLKKPDGQLARIETEYNDIIITKRRHIVTMSFQLKGFNYTESATDLPDPDDLIIAYTQFMTLGVIYPPEPKDILMIGLGGGSISTYLGRAMPDARIDTVEIDPGVITAARRFFGIRDSERVRYIDADGRVFINRSKKNYDLILVDAFHGGFVPFHLLTKEFYQLLRTRLRPGGAVAFNVHDGTKLYASTVLTLGDVFKRVDLYPSGEGEVITIATDAAPSFDELRERAASLQQQFKFRHPLPPMFAKRIVDVASQTRRGAIITDDFAPVDLYGAIGGPDKKKK